MTGENVYLLLSICLLSLCVGISLGLINVLCVDVGARAICGFWPRNDLRINYYISHIEITVHFLHISFEEVAEKYS